MKMAEGLAKDFYPWLRSQNPLRKGLLGADKEVWPTSRNSTDRTM